MATITQVMAIIQELALENIKMYPESYPISKDRNISDKKACEAIQSVAVGYWENRNEQEIERDNNLNINLQDYINWSLSELNEYAEDKKDPIDTSEYENI